MQECGVIHSEGRAMKFDTTFKAGALSAASLASSESTN